MGLSLTVTIMCVTPLFLSPSDEDDALYEKFSGEQWRLENLMQLLAELKDCDLPGAFFLDLLQVRTTHILTPVTHDPIQLNNILCVILLRLWQRGLFNSVVTLRL